MGAGSTTRMNDVAERTIVPNSIPVQHRDDPLSYMTQVLNLQATEILNLQARVRVLENIVGANDDE
jgi:hypothetical protein